MRIPHRIRKPHNNHSCPTTHQVSPHPQNLKKYSFHTFYIFFSIFNLKFSTLGIMQASKHTLSYISLRLIQSEFYEIQENEKNTSIMVKNLTCLELNPNKTRIFSALIQINHVLLLGIKNNWFLKSPKFIKLTGHRSSGDYLVSKKTLSCQKYELTETIPDTNSKKNSVPNFTSSLVIFVNFYHFIPPCLMYSAVGNSLYQFNSLLQPPFMNCFGIHSFHTLNLGLSFKPNAASKAHAIQPNIYLSILRRDTQPMKDIQNLLSQLSSVNPSFFWLAWHESLLPVLSNYTIPARLYFHILLLLCFDPLFSLIFIYKLHSFCLYKLLYFPHSFLFFPQLINIVDFGPLPCQWPLPFIHLQTLLLKLELVIFETDLRYLSPHLLLIFKINVWMSPKCQFKYIGKLASQMIGKLRISVGICLMTVYSEALQTNFQSTMKT
ncbi:hypothetical protein VP01_1378g1 [Puccinia sorghi]|uniref:Uncharacterized protein n=1 Tax=Puccinia sorghi TaxID=27349 RepID=A0A0L6VNC2_9BASI|nr:hypothetical protein VP01_1378g1 [Puccinia sorghi]